MESELPMFDTKTNNIIKSSINSNTVENVDENTDTKALLAAKEKENENGVGVYDESQIQVLEGLEAVRKRLECMSVQHQLEVFIILYTK